MTKSTNQTNQPKELEVITLPNGESAVLLVQSTSKQLAIVDLLTLQKIVRQLSEASFRQIKEEFTDKIEGTMSILEYTQVIAEEYNFQTTVNLIRTINIDGVSEGVRGMATVA